VSQVRTILLLYNTGANAYAPHADYPHSVIGDLEAAVTNFRSATQAISARHAHVPMVVVRSAHKRISELFDEASDLAKVSALDHLIYASARFDVVCVKAGAGQSG
jgi:hypothetical protein